MILNGTVEKMLFSKHLKYVIKVGIDILRSHVQPDTDINCIYLFLYMYELTAFPCLYWCNTEETGNIDKREKEMSQARFKPALLA